MSVLEEEEKDMPELLPVCATKDFHTQKNKSVVLKICDSKQHVSDSFLTA